MGFQCYGTADLGLVAYEAAENDGMIIDEDVILEIVKPGTGKPLQDGDMIDTSANIDYSVKKLSFKPKTLIEDGIPKLIEWYRSYYNV